MEVVSRYPKMRNTVAQTAERITRVLECAGSIPLAHTRKVPFLEKAIKDQFKIFIEIDYGWNTIFGGVN